MLDHFLCSLEYLKNNWKCHIIALLRYSYARAFDCVDHNTLWKVLKEVGIPDHLTCLLRNLYAGQEATVRTGHRATAAAAAAKSLQSCPTLCDPIDGSPPGSPIPGIIQARTLEWFPSPVHESEKWKWSHSVMSDSSRPHGLQPTRLLCPWDFPGKSTGVGCHHLLQGAYRSWKI